ncbi:integrase [Bradyrhizobium sp. USDA 3051]
MTDEATSPLRRRMIEDMTIRKFAPKTQHDYVQRVKNFAVFLGRSPETASFEDVRRYQLHLASSGVGVPTINQTVSTLRFFFKVTLKRNEIVEHTHVIHEPRKLPVVLSPEEVARLLDAAPGLKYKAALSVAYGAGLRANEVVSLKISDIDSKRMIIRVEQGKGGKDRNVMLSPHLLDLLRAWWKAARPQGWLFPGRDPAQPMTTPAQPRLPRRCPDGGDQQAGLAAHLAAQLRHSSLGAEHRRARDPGSARSRQARYDRALYLPVPGQVIETTQKIHERSPRRPSHHGRAASQELL